jgi:hypothetical protein
MITKIALGCVLAVVGLAVVPTSIANAGESTATARVRIVERPAVLRPDGGLRIAIAARCDPSLQAFELGLSAEQYQASGFLLRQAPPAVVLCDDLRHRQRVTVYPLNGTFAVGTAAISLYVGFYDPQQDRDLARQDTATIPVITK